MTRHIITSPQAPTSALYSHGVRAGSTVYVSGMVGLDPRTGELAGPTIHDQTRQAVRNCEAVLDAAGRSLHDVALVTVLLAHAVDFAGMNEAYATVFTNDPPASAVTRLGPDLPGILMSITMTAHLPR
jgi:2-iminobutanoate/2-iminopropanoate deaminase